MGIYLNPGCENFKRSLSSAIYVDKSMLISVVNRQINTQQMYMCLSRPRRFGKTMGLDMLAAYYVYGQDSHALFDGLRIKEDPSYEEHINSYDVIKLNITRFTGGEGSVEAALAKLERYVLFDLLDAYEQKVRLRDEKDLIQTLNDVYAATGRQFVFLIDEWDCLFREYKNDTASQKKYLDFLRNLLKDQPYVALAYMTGILPVKKYGTHSALNMFLEYSMTDPKQLAPYFGFTEEEVKVLCEENSMPFEEAKAWYDGYELSYTQPENGKKVKHSFSIYSPKSLVESMMSCRYDTYWNKTETYEALKVYIEMNFDGLKDRIVRMLAGESVVIDTGGFSNDMTTFTCADDVLALLIHLGYLRYNPEEKAVSIPNKEVSIEFMTAIKRIEGYGEVYKSIEASKALLASLLEGDAEAVSAGLSCAHEEISILTYNDENSLSCAITLAFYYAREYYTIIRELPAGKGFADIAFLPRRSYADKPALLIELKKDRTAGGAIDQIRGKNYPDALKEYSGNLLLCGINYDSKTKEHTTVIDHV